MANLTTQWPPELADCLLDGTHLLEETQLWRSRLTDDTLAVAATLGLPGWAIIHPTPTASDAEEGGQQGETATATQCT